MGRIFLEEDLFVKHSIIDPSSPEGQKIHAFLLARAKLLVGKKLDLEKKPVAFVLSDREEPNAFYAPRSSKHRRSGSNEDRNTSFVKNPLDVPVICVTRGLIDLVDNLDQLDYTLGNILTQKIFRDHGVEATSTGEGLLTNLHAVDLVFDAGADPKQALRLHDKLHERIKQRERDAERRTRRWGYPEEKTNIKWSEVFDVYLSHSNTITALQTSLTRLSHLIDDREPTEIDKSIFAVEYSDPVTAFLKANDYEEQTDIDKLRILIDCVDHISTRIPASDYYKAKQDEKEDFFAARNEDGSDGTNNYFQGPTVEKKYQQEIAVLAEAIFINNYEQRQDWHRRNETVHEDEDEENRPRDINTGDLFIYVQDKAYRHIVENGYPEEENTNFFDAAGIMYSYFYTILGAYARNERGDPSDRRPLIEVDIEQSQQQIRHVQNYESLVAAVANFRGLRGIFHNLRSLDYRRGYRRTKLDNLSFFEGHNDHYRSQELYSYPETGKPVSWSNLFDIAHTNSEARGYVVDFLQGMGIQDYRITHGQPFVRIHGSSYFGIDDSGVVTEKKNQYDIDYAIKSDEILRSYAYIKDYFENEITLFAEVCSTVSQLMEVAYEAHQKENDDASDIPVAHKKFTAFVELHNFLFEADERSQRRSSYASSVDELIPSWFLRENQPPWLSNDENSRSLFGGRNTTLDENLLRFDNPIFQSHFGQSFREQTIEAQASLRQRMVEQMFDTSLIALSTAADAWAEASVMLEGPKVSVGLEGQEVGGDKIDNQEPLMHEDSSRYKIKMRNAAAIVSLYIDSITGGRDFGLCLRGMTLQQREILADYILSDEKVIFSKLLDLKQYTALCDFKHILAQQIEAVIGGDYTLTDAMQTVGGNIGYKKADTNEALADFLASPDAGWRTSRYVWYLHLFDVMQRLERSPEIDLRTFQKLLSHVDISDRFMRESRLPRLIAKAVGYQNNYEGLSVRETIEVVDSLIAINAKVVEQLAVRTRPNRRGNYEDERGATKKAKPISRKHKRVLAVLDVTIYATIRRAQQLALQKEDALEKMEDIYCLYHENKGYGSSNNKRKTYLDVPIGDEKALEEISALSANRDFWPEDVLNHIKAYVFAKKTFLDDIEFENRLLNDILDKLEALPSGEEKRECFSILLDKDLRAAYPETRERLFELCSDDVVAELGRDDGSPEYTINLSHVLKKLAREQERDRGIREENGVGSLLSHSVSTADKHILFRRVSDKVLSQEETSDMIMKASQINLRAEDLVSSYFYGIGVDYLTAEMDRSSDFAERLLQFLNSKGESHDCNDMSDYIRDRLEKNRNKTFVSLGENKILENTKPINCKVLYENFWSAPLEARAVVIARILKSAVHKRGETVDQSTQAWEQIFDLVMDNLIRPDDASVESRYARDIMHSYAKARSDYEREIILSAVMVANRNIGADAGNVGKSLKLFLENMGPAEIKTGQAIASHPNTPKSIKREMQSIKNKAAEPSRGEFYAWIRAEKIPEELWKGKYLGKILGSASYYVTAALGEDEVLRILRPEAREKAAKGFRVISDTVSDLREKGKTSDLSYDKLTDAVSQMITQASRMADIETDTEIGQQQCEQAERIYNGVNILCDGEAFSFKVMEWRARGKNWVTMKRAEGVVFNDLPEDTPDQIAYKKAFAKAYIVFEIRRIISGRRFDHDRHGAQLCIDPETNSVGIFDTGAMALREPTVEEQRQLGRVVYDVVKSVYSSKQNRVSLSQIEALGGMLSDRIDELCGRGSDAQHLVEVKKGMLALGDFFSVLDGDDVKALVSEIDIYPHLSKPTKSEILDRMSLLQRVQLQLFLTKEAFHRKKKTISIKQTADEITLPAESFSVGPELAAKSSWFNNIFQAHDRR